MRRGAFAKKFCADEGIPWTTHTRRALMSWFQAEGGGARNNPANTTQDEFGATIYNFASVKNYPTPEVGLRAMETTFTYHGHGYETIMHRLRQNGSANSILKAIGASDWGTAGTLGMVIRAELARNPLYLRTLERKEIAS